MSRKSNAGMRIVSWKEYAVTKSLALFSSAGILACGIGIALLLLSLPYTAYLDTQSEAELSFHQTLYGDLPYISANLVAQIACFFLIPLLVLLAFGFWIGGRENRKTVRFMEPSATADTYGLPVSKTLVRATKEPPSKQQVELLRAVRQEYEIPTEQLLRASKASENR